MAGSWGDDSGSQKPARSSRGRRRLRLLLVAAVVIAAGGALTPSILRGIGGALVFEDPLDVADVIVVPGWTHESGALEAADLYKQGVASRVAVLAPEFEPSRHELIRRGVVGIGEPWIVSVMKRLDVQTIEEIPGYSTGTEADGELIATWLEDHRLRSAVVVATSDHSRRLRRIMHRALEGKAITVSVTSARFSTFEPARWWKTRAGVRITVVELQKLLLDFVSHPLD